MFSSKMVIAAAIVGFLLSFFTGLFSGVGFLFVLLRAVVFAIVFGLLFLGIKFVFERFLDMGDIESNPMPTEVNVGSMVDVTVGEDELPEEDSAPGFYVDAKLSPKNMESGTSVSSEKGPIDSINSAISTDQGRSIQEQQSSVSMAQVVDSSEKASSVQSSGFVRSDIQTMTSSVSQERDIGISSDEDLDDLPEFESPTKDISEVESSPLRGESPMMDKGAQDAEAMALAIRTILSKDG